MIPFLPAYGQGVRVTTGASSANVAINSAYNAIYIVNFGADYAYVRTGDGSVVATDTDMPIASRNGIMISKLDDHTHIAYIRNNLDCELLILPGLEGL